MENNKLIKLESKLHSTNLKDVFYAIKLLKQFYISSSQQIKEEIEKIYFNLFFTKSSIIKSELINLFTPKINSKIIQNYKHSILNILRSSDEDSINLLSKFIKKYKNEFKNEEEISFELFRKNKVKTAILISRKIRKIKKIKKIKIYYFAIKRNVDYLPGFIKFCKKNKENKYLIKAMAYYPFLQINLNIEKFEDGKYLTSFEAKQIYKHFGYFNDKICIKRMILIKNPKNYWEEFLMLKEFLKRKKIEPAKKICKKLSEIKDLKPKYKILFLYFYKILNGKNDECLLLQAEIHGLTENKIFCNLRKLIK